LTKNEGNTENQAVEAQILGIEHGGCNQLSEFDCVNGFDMPKKCLLCLDYFLMTKWLLALIQHSKHFFGMSKQLTQSNSDNCYLLQTEA
jgi:hypothetical protein